MRSKTLSLYVIVQAKHYLCAPRAAGRAATLWFTTSGVIARIIRKRSFEDVL